MTAVVAIETTMLLLLLLLLLLLSVALLFVQGFRIGVCVVHCPNHQHSWQSTTKTTQETTPKATTSTGQEVDDVLTTNTHIGYIQRHAYIPRVHACIHVCIMYDVYMYACVSVYYTTHTYMLTCTYVVRIHACLCFPACI